MTAKIIKLERFNIGCRHHANGVRFPHLYRVTGFEYDLLDEGTANARFVPGSSVPVEPFYTLSDRGDFGVANPTFQPIRSLRPDLDKGWIIVRHHASPEGAHAYIDCVGDYRPIPYDYSGPMIWQTSEGIFTLMHRPAIPGCSDHLIAYVTKVPVEGIPDFWDDAHHIVHPDARVTTDADIMYPPDSEIRAISNYAGEDMAISMRAFQGLVGDVVAGRLVDHDGAAAAYHQNDRTC